MKDDRGAVDPTRIRSDADYRILKDAPDSFLAWGPPGSQDISYIQANTAHHIRQLWRADFRDDQVQCVAGRGFIGIFTDPDEARKACEEHAEKYASQPQRTDPGHEAQGHVRPTTRTTDPESSHEADRHMDVSGKRECQQRAVLEAVHAHSGLTSKHLAQRTGLDRHMLARRLPELERANLVRRGPMVSDPGDGRQGVTWWRAEPAQEALL
ncbi:MAG: MarR family transcriptional regulator [Mycobacterium sp.]